MSGSEIVEYRIDDETVALFEFDPPDGYTPAGFGDAAAWIADAADPALRAARVVLDRVRALSPDGVEVKFGLKVTGTANWIVARASTDANFEVALSWKPAAAQPAATAPTAAERTGADAAGA